MSWAGAELGWPELSWPVFGLRIHFSSRMVRYVIFARPPGGPWGFYRKINQGCEAPWAAARATASCLRLMFPDWKYKVIVVLL